EGGHDVIGLTGCALEVKRQETLNVNAWWEQTVEQSKSNMLPKPQWPVLFYRKNHCPWSVVVLLAMINDEFNGDDSVTTVNLDTFIKIYEWRDEK
ncbi:MAG: hypothetical protein QF704_09305, partial [Anaerolineales bacterium]|nr:hypothetical protein [Anaerolineales bacterium]